MTVEIHLSDALAYLNHSSTCGGAQFIYMDPPFNTGRVQSGPLSAYNDSRTMSEFLDWMTDIIFAARTRLNDSGTIMVHVDWRTSHHIRFILDEVFGENMFLNEIAWCYRSGGGAKRNLSRKHDTILFYAKTKDYKFNILREPYPHKYSGAAFHPEGRMLNDWWDISFLSTSSPERTGYPNQKPEELLTRCIRLTTHEGELVVDPFVGSGTTPVAAHKLGRNFAGCDQNPESLNSAQMRFEALGVNVERTPDRLRV